MTNSANQTQKGNGSVSHKSLRTWYAGAAAAAGALGLYAANTAVADVVVYNSGLTTPQGSFHNGGVYFDFASGTSATSSYANADFRINWNNKSGGNNPGYVNLFALKHGNGAIGGTYSFGQPTPSKLPLGAPIGPGQVFSTRGSGVMKNNATGSNAAKWNGTLPTTGYLGLTFTVSGQTDYGWAEVTINANGSATLDQFAYQTDGGEILAGQTAAVPEPSSLLMLATGAAALGLYRKVRTRAALKTKTEQSAAGVA